MPNARHSPHEGTAFRLGDYFSGLLEACSAHGLRKACARRLAEAGATAHEIGAVTGHKTLALIQLYTEAAGREGLADSAMEKLVARPNGEKNVVNLPKTW
jgi:site-specific recombinase XerD